MCPQGIGAIVASWERGDVSNREMHIIPFPGPFLGPFLADVGMRFTTEVAEGTEFKMGISVRGTLPPRGFLRKSVILRGLEVREVQECDSKGFAGWKATFTEKHSISYTSCQ